MTRLLKDFRFKIHKLFKLGRKRPFDFLQPHREVIIHQIVTRIIKMFFWQEQRFRMAISRMLSLLCMMVMERVVINAQNSQGIYFKK